MSKDSAVGVNIHASPYKALLQDTSKPFWYLVYVNERAIITVIDCQSSLELVEKLYALARQEPIPSEMIQKVLSQMTNASYIK